jgi:geranylgeranyl diphosphate synthase, type II
MNFTAIFVLTNLSMDYIHQIRNIFEQHLANHPLSRSPRNLYEPADYILSLGGKRLRPLFALIGAGIYDRDVKIALNAAMAVEVFHNFTLLHDDVMDNADLRRGQATVHKKYNLNTAILTGDVMMIQAYQYILDYEDPILVKKLLDTYNKMAFEVCEGQQLDIDFETRNDVTIPEYLDMITWKTSVLIAAAIQMGAIVAGASDQDQKHLYEFAKYFGIAFQLQDDVLDTFGTAAEVGKRIGGDIIQNKKTYLYLKSLELADQKQQDTLRSLYQNEIIGSEDQKIASVTQIFKDTNVEEYTRQVIEAYRDLAVSHLNACSITEDKKLMLAGFVNEMIFRSS